MLLAQAHGSNRCRSLERLPSLAAPAKPNIRTVSGRGGGGGDTGFSLIMLSSEHNLDLPRQQREPCGTEPG